MVRWVVGSNLHGVDPLSYFSFQPVLHDWCNKGRGMCYPVCGMMHIKEPLLLIGMSSPCGGSGFPLSLSGWSFTICPTPYNRRSNVLSASLKNPLLPSFLSRWVCVPRSMYLHISFTESLAGGFSLYIYLYPVPRKRFDVFFEYHRFAGT